MDKLNIKIYIILAALLFGSLEVLGTKNDIKEQLDIDSVIAQHNNGIDLSSDLLSSSIDDTVKYVDRETFATVNLLQIKLATELAALFFGFMVLLQLLDKKEFSLVDSVKEMRK